MQAIVLVLENLIEMTAYTDIGNKVSKIYHHTNKEIAIEDFRKYLKKIERDTKDYQDKVRKNWEREMYG